MKVGDLLQLKREEVSANKQAEFDWYCSLEAELAEFGYMVNCTCGVSTLGFTINEKWIKEHYQHRMMEAESILDWLDKYEDKEHRN